MTKSWFKDTDISQLRVDIRKLLLEMKDVADIKMKENGETKEEHDDNDDDGFEILSPSPLKKKRRKEEKKNVEEESKKENKTPQPAGGFDRIRRLPARERVDVGRHRGRVELLVTGCGPIDSDITSISALV